MLIYPKKEGYLSPTTFRSDHSRLETKEETVVDDDFLANNTNPIFNSIPIKKENEDNNFQKQIQPEEEEDCEKNSESESKEGKMGTSLNNLPEMLQLEKNQAERHHLPCKQWIRSEEREECLDPKTTEMDQ